MRYLPGKTNHGTRWQVHVDIVGQSTLRRRNAPMWRLRKARTSRGALILRDDFNSIRRAGSLPGGPGDLHSMYSFMHSVSPEEWVMHQLNAQVSTACFPLKNSFLGACHTPSTRVCPLYREMAEAWSPPLLSPTSFQQGILGYTTYEFVPQIGLLSRIGFRLAARAHSFFFWHCAVDVCVGR